MGSTAVVVAAAELVFAVVAAVAPGAAVLELAAAAAFPVSGYDAVAARSV